MTDDDIQSFAQVTYELSLLQEAKGCDYGYDWDPLANLRATEEFGCPAWIGAIIRANDKMSRLKTAVRKGPDSLNFESVEDSLKDLAVYAIHALRLYRQSEAAGSRSFPCVATGSD